MNKLDIMDVCFIENSFDRFLENKLETGFIRFSDGMIYAQDINPSILDIIESFKLINEVHSMVKECGVGITTMTDIKSSGIVINEYEEKIIDVVYTKVGEKILICSVFKDFVMLKFNDICLKFSYEDSNEYYDKFYTLFSIVKKFYDKYNN